MENVMPLMLIVTMALNYYLANKAKYSIGLWILLSMFGPLSTVLLYYLSSRYKDWLTIDEYILKHPETNTGSGISCIKCGSKSIRNIGISHIKSKRRIHSCNSCGAELYRSGT